MPARGHAYDAQQEFAYSQLSEDPARDEWGADSFGKHTTTKSNIYGYVNGNPVSSIDPLGLAEVCERPLHLPLGLGPVLYLMGRSSIDDRLNTELKHEHIFFDDGSDIGFGPDGLFSGEKKTEYSSCKKAGTDDARVKKAVSAVGNPGTYKRLTNNCQGYVESVLNKARPGP